jgi:hypothetical protein
MGRVRLGVSTAVILALAGPAGAAEITRLQTAEPGDPFALQFSLRWDREQEKATISREKSTGGAPGAFPAVLDQDELDYSRVKNDLVTRFALALYEDVELHVDLPYSMADDATWNLAVIPASSSIATNGRDAMNQDCALTPCPLFPVSTSDATVFKGGQMGALKAGLAWGIFSDKRDDTKPTWIVGLDVTLPTGKLYDPGLGRQPNMGSPYFAAARRGPNAEKVWKWDFSTAMSRRFGPVDPYFKAHVTAVTKSSSTYSNCDNVAAFNAMAVPAATNAAVTNCGLSQWKDEAGAKLPWIAGLTFGTELIPFEDKAEDQKVTFDFRAFGDYTSQSRFYNELTDASGKLHWTEGYLTMGAYAGVYLRASRWVTLDISGSLATRTSHWLSGEYPGKSRDDDAGASDPIPADVTGFGSNERLNPNYDARYDAPGNRFRLSGVSVFNLSFAFLLEF